MGGWTTTEKVELLNLVADLQVVVSIKCADPYKDCCIRFVLVQSPEKGKTQEKVLNMKVG